MKNIKYLALVLIITLGLFGVGYAYWTDAVTINGTVETGELNVIISDAGVHVPNQYVEGSAVIDEDGKNVTVAISNLYPIEYLGTFRPNTYAALNFTITNNSTIPVVFNGADISFAEGSSAALMADVQARVGTFFFARQEALAELDDIFSSVLNGLTLGVGESYSFSDSELPNANWIRIFLNNNPFVVDNSTQGQEAVFTVTLNWKQAI